MPQTNIINNLQEIGSCKDVQYILALNQQGHSLIGIRQCQNPVIQPKTQKTANGSGYLETVTVLGLTPFFNKNNNTLTFTLSDASGQVSSATFADPDTITASGLQIESINLMSSIPYTLPDGTIIDIDYEATYNIYVTFNSNLVQYSVQENDVILSISDTQFNYEIKLQHTLATDAFRLTNQCVLDTTLGGNTIGQTIYMYEVKKMEDAIVPE